MLLQNGYQEQLREALLQLAAMGKAIGSPPLRRSMDSNFRHLAVECLFEYWVKGGKGKPDAGRPTAVMRVDQKSRDLVL